VAVHSVAVQYAAEKVGSASLTVRRRPVGRVVLSRIRSRVEEIVGAERLSRISVEGEICECEGAVNNGFCMPIEGSSCKTITVVGLWWHTSKFLGLGTSLLRNHRQV